MKRLLKSISVLMAIMVSVVLLSGMVLAEETQIIESEVILEDVGLSGKCGADVVWELVDGEGGLTLAFSGTGQMWDCFGGDDYDEDTPVRPWADYADQITEVSIGDGITYLGGNSLSALSQITHLEIPSSVTKIGDMAIAGCKALESITLSEGLKDIGEGAFGNCVKLEDVIIPDGTERIGLTAFFGCKGLKTMQIPNSVTEIGYAAFGLCDQLTIYGWKNSCAETYAEENNIAFVALDVEPLADDLFPDVADPSKSYFKPVYWAVNAGIVKGYKNGNFGPMDSCTRAQFVIMIWRMAGKPSSKATVGFKDVTALDSASKAIQWATGQGIIAGYKDKTFRPNATVTRRQVAIMLWKWQGKQKSTKNASFIDVASTDSAYNAISWGVSKGIIKGSKDAGGNPVFKPTEPCKRQQIVTFLYRLDKYVLK